MPSTGISRAHLVADLSEPLVVEEPGVGRVPGNDHLGPEEAGRLLQLVVVDQPRLLVQSEN